MVDQALRDYWRTHVYKLSKEDFIRFKSAVSFSQATEFVTEVLRSPNAVLSTAYALSAKDLVAKQTEQHTAFKDLLTRHQEELIHFVSNPPQGLAKRKAIYKAGGAEKFKNELGAFLTAYGLVLLPKSSEHLFLLLFFVRYAQRGSPSECRWSRSILSGWQRPLW